MRRWIWLFLALVAIGADAGRLTTFAWDPGSNWPPGTTVELCGNGDVCLSGLTGTQATLDLPVQPGDVIEGRARAHAPDGRSSDWGTVALTWPEVPIGIWARYEGDVPMAISYVGNGGTFAWTSGGQTDGSVTSGNVIVGVIYWIPTTDSLTSVSTNRTSSISLISNPTLWYGDVYEAAIFSGVVNSTGSLTITPTWGTGVDLWGFVFHEYSGVDTTTIVEASALQKQVAKGTGTDAYTSGIFSSLTDNAAIVGFMLGFDDIAAYSAGTGFTGRITNPTSPKIAESEDKILASAGSTQATFTSSTGWVETLVVGLALKPATAGSASLIPPSPVSRFSHILVR